MGRQLGRRGAVALAGTVVLAGPVIAACSTGPNYEQWAATDGAAGRINLDEIQAAFKQAESATEFERRVNEIYEGDGLVLIRVSQDDSGSGQTVEAFEDLDKDGVISDTSDDLLFSIVNKDNQNEMRGHGANGYYRSGFGGGNFLFTYLLLSSFGPGRYYYQTPRTRVRTMSNQRSAYRGGSRYRAQVSKNTNYFSRQKSFAGSKYNAASRNVSSGRQSYLNSNKRSGSFKTNSTTGVRSSWGSKGTGRSFGKASGGGGFFKGFGGAQTIVGIERGQRADS